MLSRPDDIVGAIGRATGTSVSLMPSANRAIELKELVPLSSVDPFYFQHTYYLGAESGSEKPYRLLTEALSRAGRATIDKLVRDGKHHLVFTATWVTVTESRITITASGVPIFTPPVST